MTEIDAIPQHVFQPFADDRDPLARYSDRRQRAALDRLLGDVERVPDVGPLDAAMARAADGACAAEVRLNLEDGMYDVS